MPSWQNGLAYCMILGKVPDDEPELPHAVLGMKLAEKYKEKAEVSNAIGSHHDEVEMNTLLAPIVQVCDAISEPVLEHGERSWNPISNG